MFSSERFRIFSCIAFVLICFFLLPKVGIAAEDFADMGENIEEQSKGLAGAAQMIFYLIGFVLVGAGLVMLAVSQDRKMALICVIIGFVLLSLGFFISMGSGSLFGSDVSNTEKLVE